jgi:pilus assembly protein CpaF
VPTSRPPEADRGPAPASAVSQIPGLMLHTPGASAIPPKPDFFSQRDEGFATLQAQAAEAFFGSIDPQTLPMYYPPRPEDRHIFEQTVNEIVGSLGAGADLVEHLLGEAIGLGPLEALLDDPSVEEIYVNNYAQVLFRQNGRVVTASRAYSHPEFLFLAAQRLLSARVEEGGTLADEVRFSDGTRVHILMPPLAPRGPVLTVRKARAAARSMDDLVAANVLSAGMASMLHSAVEAGRSIIVAGPTERARTEVLNALGNLIPEGTRILAVENVGGLRLNHQSAVYMEEGAGDRNQHGMRYLMRCAMRMRPDRILVNSLTGPEAYDWVSAAAAGTFGSMASCAGIATRDVLERIQTLCQLGATDLSPRGLREQIARAAHVVVVVHQASDGSPRVQQISEIQGIDLDSFRVSDVFYYRPEGSAGHFVATGYVPAFYETLRMAGINADTRVFNT